MYLSAVCDIGLLSTKKTSGTLKYTTGDYFARIIHVEGCMKAVLVGSVKLAILVSQGASVASASGLRY